MRLRVLFCVATIMMILRANAQVQVARENVIISSQIHGFWEYLPVDYQSNPQKTYPLLVEWHGVGEAGNGSLPALEMVRIHGVARVVKAGLFPKTVTFNGQSYSFIVLSPQYMDAVGMSVADMDSFLNYAFTHYRVDRNRVYMTGYSLGAMLLYQYAGQSNAQAQKLTAMVPVSPCSNANFGNAKTIAANNVAVYGIHGAEDIQCPWQWTVNWSNSINSANGTPPVPPAVYSLTPGLNSGDPHDIFWFTFEPGWSAPPVNKNIYDWMIQYSRTSSTPPPPPSFNCDSIKATPGSGSISLAGLSAPVITIQVFNNNWATVYNQTLTNSPGTHTIPSLTTGTYHVKVSFYTSGWSPICDKTQDVVVQNTPPQPIPPPNGCDAVTVKPARSSINVTGLTAPVVTVQVFNNSWATVYNKTFTNSPGSTTISSLPAGTYHVNVRFNTSSWSLICEKMFNVVVSTSGPGN